MTITTILIAGALVALTLVVVRSASRASHLDPEFDPPTEAGFSALLASGRKIDAIKVYRRLHGVDLKAAKEAVERIMAERHGA